MFLAHQSTYKSSPSLSETILCSFFRKGLTIWCNLGLENFLKDQFWSPMIFSQIAVKYSLIIWLSTSLLLKATTILLLLKIIITYSNVGKKKKKSFSKRHFTEVWIDCQIKSRVSSCLWLWTVLPKEGDRASHFTTEAEFSLVTDITQDPRGSHWLKTHSIELSFFPTLQYH